MKETSRRAIEWQNRNPEKVKAHSLVNKAIKSGKLIKGNCEVCGNAKVDGHHGDYSKPLEVRWLCRIHHMEVHYGIKEVVAPSLELHTLATETAKMLGQPTAYAIILDALERVQAIAASQAASSLSQSRKGKPLTEKELARNNNASKIAAEKRLVQRKAQEIA